MLFKTGTNCNGGEGVLSPHTNTQQTTQAQGASSGIVSQFSKSPTEIKQNNNTSAGNSSEKKNQALIIGFDEDPNFKFNPSKNPFSKRPPLKS